MTKNFTVTKHLTKFKETLINYVWENLTLKTSKNEISRRFHIFEFAQCQKAKTRKCRKSTENFLNQKSTQC